MGLLDGGIEAIFGAAFSGLYLDGTLHRDGTDPVYDNEGNIPGYSDAPDIPVKCQIDAATYAMRQSEGFSEGDVRIIVLSAGLAVPITADMQLSAQGKRWMIASVERDAAASHWVLRGRAA